MDDVAADTEDVRLLGARAVMTGADCGAHAIEESRFFHDVEGPSELERRQGFYDWLSRGVEYIRPRGVFRAVESIRPLSRYASAAAALLRFRATSRCE